MQQRQRHQRAIATPQPPTAKECRRKVCNNNTTLTVRAIGDKIVHDYSLVWAPARASGVSFLRTTGVRGFAQIRPYAINNIACRITFADARSELIHSSRRPQVRVWSCTQHVSLRSRFVCAAKCRRLGKVRSYVRRQKLSEQPAAMCVNAFRVCERCQILITDYTSRAACVCVQLCVFL